MPAKSNTTALNSWHSLNRNIIIEHIWSKAYMLTGPSIPVDQFHTTLTRHIKKLVPVRFRKNRDIKVSRCNIWVGGQYHSKWDQENKKYIELQFVYPTTKCMNISEKQFKGICDTIADTLLHEIIHVRQFRRRNFKELPDFVSTVNSETLRLTQNYLGCPDEIDAYSFNIACELFEKFNGNEHQIINYLSENQKGKRQRHSNWVMYLTAFRHNHSHPILQRVKKKVIKYLPQAQIGKPYSNSNWLHC